MNQPVTPPASVYFIQNGDQQLKHHTLAVLVDTERDLGRKQRKTNGLPNR